MTCARHSWPLSNDMITGMLSCNIITGMLICNIITGMLICNLCTGMSTCNIITVCFFGVFCPTRQFSLIWRLERAANFDLCSALMAIEQWRLFSVPHLLWYGASVYNGHLRGLVTLAPIAERLAVELSLYDFVLSRVGFEHPTLRLQGELSSPLRHRRGYRYVNM